MAIDPDLLHDEFRRVLDLRDLLAVLVHLHVERAHQPDPVRELALELWQSTVVSQSWIAQRLAMKSAANVSQILRRIKTR